MEQDAAGRRRHYYYWEQDSKKLARLTKPLFEGFTTQVVRSTDGIKLELRWPTASVPHQLLPATVRTFIVKLRLLDGKTAVFSKTLRFFSPTNRSADDIRPLNPADELVTLATQETFIRSYALPANFPTSGTVELTVLKKGNFDYPDDDTIKLVFRRESAFQL